MTDLPTHVEIHEEGPREGFQIESGPISTVDKIGLIEALAETAGMVSFRGGLDLDDVGAELGKYHPGGRPHHRMAELQGSYASQRGRRLHTAARRRNASRLPAWINSPGNW